jgi:hypothetical protein
VRVTCPCGVTWDGYRIEHCTVPGCHQTFMGTTVGDMHRVGDFRVTEGPDRRRCLTPDEMRAQGLRQDDEGRWHRAGARPWERMQESDE